MPLFSHLWLRNDPPIVEHNIIFVVYASPPVTINIYRSVLIYNLENERLKEDINCTNDNFNILKCKIIILGKTFFQ